METRREKLLQRIKVLNEGLWEGRVTLPRIEEWLGNFRGEKAATDEEQLHALFMLSQFMYFGDAQVRECLCAMYRDLYRYPLIREIRQRNGDSLDTTLIETEFDESLKTTRFVGVGNPAESGCHLLYYFRQENELGKDLFMNGYEIFGREEGTNKMTLSEPDVSSYVFIDDFCGSGSQCVKYLSGTVRSIKELRPTTSVRYFCVLATQNGMERIRHDTVFDQVEAVFTIDSSYQCFSDDTQVFITAPAWFSPNAMREIAEHYGNRIAPGWPLGFGDGQLLLGFHHNIPDNTLPVIWVENPALPWFPIFRRYHKKYKMP